MTDTATPPPPDDDAGLLLPWYATGRLPAAEAERVRRELAADPTLAHRLALTQEEQAGAIASAEALPAPSSRARDDLFARIDALEAASGRAQRRAIKAGLAGRLAGWFEALGPRKLAWAGGLAALLIVVQAGWIAATLVRPEPATYRTASREDDSTARGTFALVGFAPGASVAQVTAYLVARGFVVVDGPRGSLYRLRVSAEPLSTADRDRLVGELRGRSDLFAVAAPAP